MGDINFKKKPGAKSQNNNEKMPLWGSTSLFSLKKSVAQEEDEENKIASYQNSFNCGSKEEDAESSETIEVDRAIEDDV